MGNFDCGLHTCNYDLVINLNDENSIFVVYKKKTKIMQSLFNPSIFKIKKFQLNLLKPDLLKDLVSIYLYVQIFLIYKFYLKIFSLQSLDYLISFLKKPSIAFLFILKAMTSITTISF